MSSEKKLVFVGSSLDAINSKVVGSIVKDIRDQLQLNGLSYLSLKVWTSTNWKNLETALNELCTNIYRYRYAIFIGYPDDIIERKDGRYFATRDNVILEFGLFLSLLGRERTFLVTPRDLIYGDLDERNRLEHRLPSDIGSGPFLNGYALKYFGGGGKYQNVNWRHQSSNVSNLIEQISSEEERLAALSQNPESYVTDLGKMLIANLRKEKEDEGNNAAVFGILFKNLEELIYARSIASSKSVKDTVIDIFELITRIRDILDVDQLIREQIPRKVRKVWVFADRPIEFVDSSDERVKRLRNRIISNIREGVEYWYFVGGDFNVKDIKDFLPGDAKFKKFLKNIKVIKIDSKYFKTFFTIHFSHEEPKNQPSKIFMSALFQDRNDILIQITETNHFLRIYDQIRILQGRSEDESGIKVINFTPR